ncbi:MAG: type II secretion system major pseudopilin GspG, partial [bacterium]|nr:type II secretion system major pseudopilin GspG [bacterium]
MRHKREMRNGIDGFTLLELLVVLAILAVIAVIAVPRVIDYLDRAKSDSAAIAIENLATTLDLYRLDVGRYPSQAEGLVALVEAPEGVATWNGPYLRKAEMLNDPWGNPYQYSQPGDHGPFDLYSLGADNTEGGEDADKDVVSW